MAWKVCLLQFRCKSRFFRTRGLKVECRPMNYEPPSCKGLNTRIPIFEERVFSSAVYSR